MNYERFKKKIVSMALMFVFAFSTIGASVTPVFAQWYYPQQPRWERRIDRDYWRMYRRVYRDPWSSRRYYRYRYGIYNPYYGYPSYYPYRYTYPYGYYGRYGRFVYYY